MERKQSIASLDMDQIEKFCIHLENSAELNDKPESSTLVEAEVIEKVLKDNYINYRTRSFLIITLSDKNISF